MASFFGEVLEPSTRAIFDDFEDGDEARAEPKLQLVWADGQEKVPTVLDAIFIFHGRLSLAFAETYVTCEGCSLAGEIFVENSESTSDSNEYSSKEILPSRIYFQKNLCICLVSPGFSTMLGYQFSEAISSLLKSANKVIVFTNESLYNYKTPSLYSLPPAFVKELKTSHNLGKNKGDPMETPNFISGIPAGVLTWCQIFEKDASAFVCYTDQEKLDSLTASPYISILKKFSYNLIKTENPNFKQKTFYGNPGIIGGSSNIYM